MHTSVASAEEPTVDVKLSLVFPREALSVPVMRHMLGDALRGLGADDDGLAELLLAVTEACTNVVRHGGPGRRYEVIASLGRRGCRVEVQNARHGFGKSFVKSWNELMAVITSKSAVLKKAVAG